MFKKLFLLLTTIYVCTTIIKAQVKPNLYSSVNELKMNRWVDSVFNRMNKEERIGQLFMPIVNPSTEKSNINEVISLIRNQKIGGILFQRGNPLSQVKVTNRAQKESKTPLLIALDGEWGLSMRLSRTARFPKNMMAGAVIDLKLIEQYGEEIGRQCREMGIHVNFAPDMDVNSNAANPVIGIRSFGEDPQEVANRGIAYSHGLEKAGIVAVAKHFPGHGDTHKDSHHVLPTVNHGRERLENVELYPFKKYIESGFSGIMTGHLNVPALGTNGNPASLSYAVTTELLRNEMNFDGLCFTDGLAMKGAAGKGKSIAVQALKAGNDILLGSVNVKREFEAVKQAVERNEIKISDINERCRRILRYKYIAGVNAFTVIPEKNLYERLNTPHTDWLNAKLNAEAVTLVKNDTDIVPIKQLGEKRIAAVSLSSSKNNEFHKTLKKYGNIDCFNISKNTGLKERGSTYSTLNNYDLIICSVHSSKARETSELQNLAAQKNVVFVFFTTPYKCKNFRQSLKNARAAIIGYEPTDLSMSYCAQAVFGGIPIKGKLPVSISDSYPAGTGIETEKIRLGFHRPEEVNINPQKLKAIDSIISEGLEKKAYPGGRIIIGKDGMVIYNKSFGHYDYQKQQQVTEETLYDLASMSKATGTLLAVMRSYDEGNFKLTDKISTFVTGLKNSDKKNITIKNLLYHQSGLPATINFYEKAIDPNSYSGSLFSARKTNSHRVRFDARTYVNADFRYKPEMVSNTRKKGFTAKAGDNLYINDTFVEDSIVSYIKDAKMIRVGKYRYSCINFILLKMMVEEQLKQPLDKFLDEQFFSRLGASSTTYNPLEKMDKKLIAPSENDRFIRRQVLQGYVHDESAAFQGGVSGNAGMFSTAGDFAKIMQLYLNNGMYGGERYLSTRTCKLFTGSKSPISRRGLGFDKPDTKNTRSSPCGRLAPHTVYGHTGYTGTGFWVDPENNMFFIFLSNRTYPSRVNTKLFSLDIRTRIQDAIYKAMQ